MHAVERIHAIISAIGERRTEWVYIKYLDTSFTHGPSSICVVKLNPLKNNKRVLLKKQLQQARFYWLKFLLAEILIALNFFLFEIFMFIARNLLKNWHFLFLSTIRKLVKGSVTR